MSDWSLPDKINFGAGLVKLSAGFLYLVGSVYDSMKHKETPSKVTSVSSTLYHSIPLPVINTSEEIDYDESEEEYNEDYDE